MLGRDLNLQLAFDFLDSKSKMVGMRIMLVLALGEWPRRRSEMSDLHEARRAEREPQIDTVGWLFLVVAVAITAAAAMVAYNGHEGVFGNAPVSRVAAR